MGPGRLVFALAFAAYAWTAAAAPGWLDSSEFVAASASFGIAHPPGHPIPVTLGRAAMLLPIGDAYFRVSLASAIAGALAAVALWGAARETLRMVAPSVSTWARDAVAAGAALGFALTWSAWIQSVRAEVYAVEAALVFAALTGLLRYLAEGERRSLYASAFALGLALANHHYVTLVFAVPAATVLLLARLPGWRTAARAALFGALGLAVLAHLPARGAREPLVDWGEPTTAARFVWTVSAQAFHRSLGEEHAGDPATTEVGEIAGTLAGQAGLPLLALSAAGIGFAAWRRRARGAGASILAVVAASVIGRALLGFDDDNPDAHGYLLPALGGVLVLASCGLAGGAEWLPSARARREATVIMTAVACAFPVLQLVRFGSSASQRGAYSAEAMARAVMDPLPSGTLLITAYHETMFATWALRAVEQERPDVTLLDRNFLTHPFAPAQARRRHPGLAPLIDAPLRGGLPTPVRELAAVAARRPVAFELSFNLHGDDPVLEHLVPAGPITLFHADPPDATTRAAAESRDAAAIARMEQRMQGDARPDADTLRMRLYEAYLAARFYCALGRHAPAAAAIARARSVAPNDPAVDELARHCSGRSP